MNKLFKGLLTAVLFTSMCACSNDEVNSTSQVETSELQLSFFDEKVESFDKTRADDDEGKTLKDFFDVLDIAIIPVDKSKNSEVYHVKQANTDADFGKLSKRLPIGKYTLVAIASKKDVSVKITSPTQASFSDENILDMAKVTQDLDLKSGTNTLNAVLQRSFAKMVIKSTDNIENNVTKVKLTYTGKFSKTFNPTTGFGIVDGEEKTYTRTIVPNHPVPSKTITMSFSTFIPEDVVTWKVGVVLYDAEGGVVKELNFDNVKVQQNHITTYTGPLFSSSSSFNFTFNNVALAESEYGTNFSD